MLNRNSIYFGSKSEALQFLFDFVSYGWIFYLSNLSYEKEIILQYLLHLLTFKIHKQQKSGKFID